MTMIPKLPAVIGVGAVALLLGITQQQSSAPASHLQADSDGLTPAAYVPHVEQNALPTATQTTTPTETPTGTLTPTVAATETPTGTLTPTQTATETPTGTLTPTVAATETPTGTLTPTVAATETPTGTLTPTESATETPTAAATRVDTPPLESFERPAVEWLVGRQEAAGGSVTQSTTQVASGTGAAHLATSAAGASAYVYATYSDPASARNWGERPGVWRWQRAHIYLPSTTVSKLGANDSLTIGGLWPTAGSNSHGWWMQVRKDGRLYVDGYDADGARHIFDAYGALPLDQWVDVELGLHSQNGPGLKRAFAFIVNGAFYGWYHQGRLTDETYDRTAFGILATTTAQPMELYVDDWQAMTTASLPSGPDNRPTTATQEIDYRQQSGARWQIDWSTWGKDLRMDAQQGLYSNSERLQSGMNLDRMPDLTSGWAEIEIGWPKGTPPTKPNGYFGPMVGFRKEIAVEENLEVIPIGDGNGGVRLVLEAWVNGGPVIMAEWPMPVASIGGTHVPEAGDIIRARWDQVQPAGSLHVRASYYDASSATWHNNVIDHTFNANGVSNNGVTVDFNDGNHKASSITIDSPAYSIRRFKAGTTATAPTN